MEHRWGNRVPADIEVQIFVDPASTAWARLRDISVSGGFLETALKIPTLSTLRVNAPCTRTESVRVVRAIAIRSDAAGVGVEWFDDDFEVVACLIQDATNWRRPPMFAIERHGSRVSR
jgi:hypothetical protein